MQVHVITGRKRKRCGKCTGCTITDCGTCKYCKDKKKFGGPDRLKQSSLVPGQIFATQKRNGTKRRKLGLVHTARVLVRMLIPFPRIWGIRNLLYIPATLYRILVRFVKNGRAIILENGVFRVSCCFPRLLLA